MKNLFRNLLIPSILLGFGSIFACANIDLVKSESKTKVEDSTERWCICSKNIGLTIWFAADEENEDYVMFSPELSLDWRKYCWFNPHDEVKDQKLYESGIGTSRGRLSVSQKFYETLNGPFEWCNNSTCWVGQGEPSKSLEPVYYQIDWQNAGDMRALLMDIATEYWTEALDYKDQIGC